MVLLLPLSMAKKESSFETKLLGELNILNILSAVAVARHLGVSWNVIQRAAKQMKQVEHRLELKKINGYRFIDDAFNANPTGSAMALGSIVHDAE
jgi:UDP-N-acetylmuramoyl-tripeptide--D-alanyl-D-alanine ligase